MEAQGQGDIFESLIPEDREPVKAPEEFKTDVGSKEMVRTSFFVSNVLLSILIKNGITTEEEVDKLLKEAIEEYKSKRGPLS